MGCHLIGACLPKPDLSDNLSVEAGVQARFMSSPPKPKNNKIARLKLFVRAWVRKNLKKIPSNSDVSVANWLSHCSYPAHRKKELLDKWEKLSNIRDARFWSKYVRCKSFPKDEPYIDWKHVRGINSRSDEFKCAVGPIFKLMEDIVYKHKAFIKHVPVADRARYVMEMLYKTGATYYATDYTAFESLFTAELMEACEFELYSYLVEDLPAGEEFMGLIRDAFLGINMCEFRGFTAKVPATRMSGEMCTSLGNGFSNLMFMLFIAAEKGISEADVEGVVEGDDAAFSAVGEELTGDDFTELGLNVKIEKHIHLNEVSFCGLIFDVDDQIIVTDPRKVVADFAWTGRDYCHSKTKTLKVLLRCKALSMAFSYPGCPIIAALADYGLRVTRSVDIHDFVRNKWKTPEYYREWLIMMLPDERKLAHRKRVVLMSTRFLVEKKFGISVEDQLKIEAYLDGLESIQPLDLPWLVWACPESWSQMFSRYLRTVLRSNPDFDHPKGIAVSDPLLIASN